MIGIPHGGENVGSAWAHVHSNRARLTRDVVWHGRNGQYVLPCRDGMIVFATLDDVRDRSAIDLEISDHVPTEIGHSDHNQTASTRSGGVGDRDCREENENQNKSADTAG